MATLREAIGRDTWLALSDRCLRGRRVTLRRSLTRQVPSPALDRVGNDGGNGGQVEGDGTRQRRICLRRPLKIVLLVLCAAAPVLLYGAEILFASAIFVDSSAPLWSIALSLIHISEPTRLLS